MAVAATLAPVSVPLHDQLPLLSATAVGGEWTYCPSSAGSEKISTVQPAQAVPLTLPDVTLVMTGGANSVLPPLASSMPLPPLAVMALSVIQL